jgi:hypothetical protein
MKSKVNILLIVFYLVTVSMIDTAYAYTDPGSGLMMWQMLSAAAVGALFYFRKAISKISNRLKNVKKRK